MHVSFWSIFIGMYVVCIVAVLDIFLRAANQPTEDDEG